MNFYEKPLHELNDEEWEQICMHCGKCCMCKYSEDGFIHFSNQVCRFFDIKEGICSCYADRLTKNRNDCRKVSLELLANNLELLPPSCAYRRLYEGHGLPEYHPLLTGDTKSPEKAKATVKSMPVFSEDAFNQAALSYIDMATHKHLSKTEITREIRKLRKKFQLKWLESYPSIHSKPT